VIVNAGADQTNALRQAVEYRITRGGQAVTVFGMTINAVNAMGLDVAQGLQFTDPMYWDHTPDTRAWAKRFMDRNNGVAPTYIMASAYTAATHYLKAVQAAGTDEGGAVMARMKATPINDFSMKNVRIREDGQAIRPVYVVQVKQPSESKGRYDFYTVKGELPGEQVFRPLADGGCDFIKK
jgi:branched-chain amino acid transport system substrate-binding protein